MICHPTTPRKIHRGFTLLEMIVNLGIVSFLLLAVAATAGWSSDAVTKTRGRIAAMEKSTELTQILTADLSRVFHHQPHTLHCEASSDSWTLKLLLPRREAGYETITYHWDRAKQTVHRQSDTSEPPSPVVIATGITLLESNWLNDLTSLQTPDAPQQASWSEQHAPAFLSLHLKITRAPSRSPDAAVSPAKLPTSLTTALLPVGKGHSSTP